MQINECANEANKLNSKENSAQADYVNMNTAGAFPTRHNIF